MLKNLGLTQRYKIISTLRSRFSGQLYKVEATQSSRSYLMLVLPIPNENLSVQDQQKIEQVNSFFTTHSAALPLEALSLEGSQLIAVQPWSNTPPLDQGAQISAEEGRQLLIQGLKLIHVAQDAEISLGGLQPEHLTWDGRTLKVLPLGTIAAQITSPQATDLAQLASSVIWAVTHLSVDPGRSGQFWQAQIQLEDPELRAVLEGLLTGQTTDAAVSLGLLNPSKQEVTIAPVVKPSTDVTSKGFSKDESDLKTSIVPSSQASTPLTSELAAAHPPAPSDTSSPTNNGPVLAGILAGCLGVAFIVGFPLSIIILSDRNTNNLDISTAEQAELERKLEETKRALEEERARAAANQQSFPSTRPTPSERRSPETISSSLDWQPSCGSPRGSGTTWWPVKAEVSSLQVMKEVYCGDAYIRGSDVQIASFTNQSEAREFASLIASETGYRVFVDAPVYRD